MSTNSSPTVILIGLPYNHPKVPAEIQQRVKDGLAQVDTLFADTPINYTFIPVTPESKCADLKQTMQLKRPDAVVIGNGIRSNMELTAWMEELIEVIRKEGGEGCRLLFNTTPDTTVDAVKRAFPGLF
ncbi:hypothetical protein DFS34DRAFT_589870 [Phlyctochytrium arcticum]|nr:hypothetical protein DFS34DRAFT_589870 [Phlyctochytrium arcticum]